MIIEPPFPFGHTLFCDDVRQEASGKVTFVGAYSGEMNVHSDGPVAIPQLCLVATFIDSPEAITARPFIYRVILAGSAGEQILAEIPFDPPEQAMFDDLPSSEQEVGTLSANLRIEARLTPLLVIESCLLKSRIYRGDEEIRLGTMRINLKALDQPA